MATVWPEELTQVTAMPGMMVVPVVVPAVQLPLMMGSGAPELVNAAVTDGGRGKSLRQMVPPLAPDPKRIVRRALQWNER
jgi:hypothetical protein